MTECEDMQPEMLFELSWEVCNKVGGIYTVVMSKVSVMKQHFKEYILIGPYIEEKASLDFIEETVPEQIADSIAKLRDTGIACHFGRWNIAGKPACVLIDFRSFLRDKNHIKKELWDIYKIDSLNSPWEFDEPIVWGYAAGMFIKEYAERFPHKRISVHCHEWLAGSALLYLKANKVRAGTVFTTHATMLGRAIAGSNQDLYGILDKVDPEQEAYKLRIQEKFQTERACARSADCFTTVSEITSIEAEKFFGRKADVLVLNGLEVHKFPTIEETSIRHVTVREKIREFLMYYFFPYYSFDLRHNIIFFILGRYEFRNKGIDIFIKALGQLNALLKEENSGKTVSVFFWIPADHRGLKTEMLENKNYFRHINDMVHRYSPEMIKKTVAMIMREGNLSSAEVFTDEFKEHVRKDLIHFKRKGDPPLCTHYLDENHDIMISEFKRNGLLNRECDRVKVIAYPVYLDGHDEMLNLNYYDAIAGCHLGVFPSYYEPWGYTPLEAAALGVASLTTDLSGFGRFIQSHKQNGIYILRRMGRSEDETIQEFTQILRKYIMLSHEERVEKKTEAKATSLLCTFEPVCQVPCRTGSKVQS